MILTSMVLLLLTGCADSKEQASSTQTAETTTSTASDPTDSTQSSTQSSTPDIEDETLGEGSLQTDPRPPARNRLRMNIDQLRTSMEQITSGVQWKSGGTDLWKKYQTTLGVPDYMESMSEDLGSSVIFQKFLKDAATYSCEQWISNDISMNNSQFFAHAPAEQTDETAVRENLQHLRYLIHGRAADTETPIIDSYYQLYQLVLQRTDEPIAAWNTVCVGFFTHPDFFTY